MTYGHNLSSAVYCPVDMEKSPSKWVWGVAAPAVASAGFFIGAALYEPSSEGWDSISIDREDEEPFVIDPELVGLNLFGLIFAVQVVNHASILIWPIRRPEDEQ